LQELGAVEVVIILFLIPSATSRHVLDCQIWFERTL
jgi:hypothetical protein